MSIAAIASEAGADDLFVLRRVEDNRFYNLDGHGRGAGWAGNVTIDPGAEPWIARALTETTLKKRSGVPFKVFGPYWASEVVATLSDDDLIVMSGNGVTGLADETLVELARRAGEAARDIPPDKAARDEAEIRQAIGEVAGFQGSTIEEAALHLASTAARALSCEFGAVLLMDPRTRVFLADEGWTPTATEDEIIAALLPLHQAAASGMFVEQDVSASPYPYRPLSFEDGLVTRCCVPLGEGGRQVLLVAAHAGTAPRGFTTLCSKVASSVAEAGQELLTKE